MRIGPVAIGTAVARRSRPCVFAALSECYGNLVDLVSSAAELYFLPGTASSSAPAATTSSIGARTVALDLELRPRRVTVYAKLQLGDKRAGWRSPMSPSRTPQTIRPSTFWPQAQGRQVRAHGRPSIQP